MLQQSHPELVAIPCNSCERWVYREDWSLLTDDNGNPYPRPKGKTPCYKCPKCGHAKEKTPAAGREAELSRKNNLTLQKYYEQLVTPLEVDDVARENFGIIRETFDDYDRAIKRTMVTILVKK